MIKFQVLENKKPAILPNLGWENFEHKTLLGAQRYAHAWLGNFAPSKYLNLGEPFYYAGTDDFVVIKKVEK